MRILIFVLGCPDQAFDARQRLRRSRFRQVRRPEERSRRLAAIDFAYPHRQRATAPVGSLLAPATSLNYFRPALRAPSTAVQSHSYALVWNPACATPVQAPDRSAAYEPSARSTRLTSTCSNIYRSKRYQVRRAYNRKCTNLVNIPSLQAPKHPAPHHRRKWQPWCISSSSAPTTARAPRPN